MSNNTALCPTAEYSIHSMVGRFERTAGVTLSSLERLFLSTDGTVTHMLEALTRQDVSVEILDREVSGDRLYRTVALRCKSEQQPVVWARSTVHLPLLSAHVADELVDGDAGIGDLLRTEYTETRRSIVELNTRSDREEFPWYVETDASCLLERTYQIYASEERIMTITEYLPKGRLSRYRTR